MPAKKNPVKRVQKVESRDEARRDASASSSASLTHFAMEPMSIDPKILAKYGGEWSDMLFCKAKMTVELDNICASGANALRRVMLDELVGHCLSADPDGGTSARNCVVKNSATDPFIIDSFLHMNIMCIPLRYDLPKGAEDAVFELSVTNNTPVTISIKSGHIREKTKLLREPLFNPGFTIGLLMPNCSVEIKELRISRGIGSKNARLLADNYHAAYQPVRRAASVPLDLAEYSDKEIREPGHDLPFGSGYKESVFTANPRKHRVTAIVPAVSGDGIKVGKQIVADSCDGVIDRVRLIRGALTETPNWNIRLEFENTAGAEGGAGVEGVLNLKYETHTIGALMRRVIFDLYPECSVNYAYLTHNYMIELHVWHPTKSAKELILAAVDKIEGDFAAIKTGL
jgi:hypothetical protein